MNKKDLGEFVASSSHITKSQAKRVVEGVFKGIMDGLVHRNDCQFIGFGSFKIRQLKARMGRNPKTGQLAKIPSSKSVKFTPSKQLKDSLNQ